MVPHRMIGSPIYKRCILSVLFCTIAAWLATRYSKTIISSPRSFRLSSFRSSSFEKKPLRIHFFNYVASYLPRNPFVECNDECYMTTGHDTYQNSTVVLFLGARLQKFPPKKYNGQTWIFFGIEAPPNHASSFENWDNLINWTMTYRRDSDIYTAESGVFEKVNQVDSERIHISNKTKQTKVQIAWMMSNCNYAANRKKYVQMLNSSKSIQVDIFGRCGEKKCPRTVEADCMNVVGRNYSFYLSFENSLCFDYISDKSFKIYLRYVDAIPITRGIGHYYHLYLPPGSFLNTEDYKGIAHLQKDIIKIGTNYEIFKTFFEWRKHFKIRHVNFYAKYFCDLCKRLHEEDMALKYKRLYGDFNTWFWGEKKEVCSQPKDDYM